MSYYLRDRPDGQVEVLFLRPIMVGICDSWAEADQARVFLKDEYPDLPDLPPINFWEAKKDVAEAEVLDLSELVPDSADPVRVALLRLTPPTVASVRPVPSPQLPAIRPPSLSQDDMHRAFARIQQGEEMRVVAGDLRISMFQLSSAWDSHRREMQVFMASAGRQPCLHCGRPFTPSISSPETCARCSK